MTQSSAGDYGVIKTLADNSFSIYSQSHPCYDTSKMDFPMSLLCPLLTSGVLFQISLAGTLDNRVYLAPGYPSEGAKTNYNVRNTVEYNWQEEQKPEINEIPLNQDIEIKVKEDNLLDEGQLEEEKKSVNQKLVPGDVYRYLNQEPLLPTVQMSLATTLDDRDHLNNENSQTPSERVNTSSNESNMYNYNRNEERDLDDNCKNYKGYYLPDDAELDKEKKASYQELNSPEDTDHHRSLTQEISRAGTTDDRDHLAPERNVPNHENSQFPSDRANTYYKECTRGKCNRHKEKEPENGFFKDTGYDLPDDAQLEKEKKTICQKQLPAEDTNVSCSSNQETTTTKADKINNLGVITPDLNCCQCRCLGICGRECWGGRPWVCVCPHTCGSRVCG